MELQSKKRSFWSTFKNAYLRSYNLKKFWKNLNKDKIEPELVDTLNLFINSKSYDWSSKFWRRLAINHLKLISSKSFDNSLNDIGREYFTLTHLNENIIKDACNSIQQKKIDLKLNIFTKQKDFSYEESINHNVILYLLYENIKDRNIFRYFEKNQKINQDYNLDKPNLKIDGFKVTQDDLNSLLEYEKIEILINSLKLKKNKFLEIGAGAGRTASTILALNDKVKYVIADIPPAINYSIKSLSKKFPEKKITTGFTSTTQEQLINDLDKNDILFIFPHQIQLLPSKFFDISIAVDCLHEMDEKIVKKYISSFEKVSSLLYFKVWEYAGLPNSFFKTYSIHNKKDYFISNEWDEIFKERCFFPSNYFQVGYKFK